jgi:site-specific recombinase XerD
LPLPAADRQPLPHLEAEEWQQLLSACRPPHESGAQAEQATARNRAILWVLFETGMQTTELCALRLGDVDRGKRELLVRGKGAQERRFTLGHEGWYRLLTYLDDYRPSALAGGEQAERSSEYLFLSERGRPLTKNGIMHVFERLKNRAGITGKQVTASLLRKNFAARYLQAGGDRDSLQELLG